jgi:hypothetical protein
MQQPRGLERLSEQGTQRLERTAAAHGPRYMGLDVMAFVDAFRAFAGSGPDTPDDRPRIELEP